VVELLINHIVSDDEHRRGKPYIKGTGITVQNIVEDTAAGLSLDYLAGQFDLTLGQIYATLSYYYDHKDEIDNAIEGDKAALAELMASDEYKHSQEHVEQIKAKLNALKSGKS
jgi:uncharacterized protein (DUF433 family)